MKSITIPGQPVAKPRMTRSDKWKKRICVMAYRAWCDWARLKAFKSKSKKLTLTKATTLHVVAYLQPRGKNMKAGPHTQRPDADNILKAVCDALFVNDEMIYAKTIKKLWSDGAAPRMDVSWD